MSTSPSKIITVDNNTDSVKCDGGSGVGGHPVVWYSFDDHDEKTCLYCDHAFVKKRSLKAFKAGKAV